MLKKAEYYKYKSFEMEYYHKNLPFLHTFVKETIYDLFHY